MSQVTKIRPGKRPLDKMSPNQQTVMGPVDFVVPPTAPVPTLDAQLANKFYVDAISAGMDWQESVLSIEITAPLAPVLGDRHLIGVVIAPLDPFFGHDDEIAEWDGLAWDFSIPNPGWITYVEGLNVYYVWNGVAWTDFFNAYLRIDGTNSMGANLNMNGNAVDNASSINGEAGSPLRISTLDTNQNVQLAPHGNGVVSVGGNAPNIQSITGTDLVLSTLDNNKNVQITPNGTGVLEPTKSQDMTGGSGKWFRPPSMTTVQATAMVVGWGASDAGKQWYDTTTNQFMGWNGVSAVILG